MTERQRIWSRWELSPGQLEVVESLNARYAGAVMDQTTLGHIKAELAGVGLDAEIVDAGWGPVGWGRKLDVTLYVLGGAYV